MKRVGFGLGLGILLLPLFLGMVYAAEPDKLIVHEQPLFDEGEMAIADYAAFDNPGYYYAGVQTPPAGVYYRSVGLSPDGTELIAQKSWNDGTYDRIEIVLMDADGSNEVVISPGDSGVGDIYGYQVPFWSDDGSAIGFVEVHNTNPNKVMRYDVSTATLTYIYEPVAPDDVANPDFVGNSTTAIVFWAYGPVGGADLFVWDGTTRTNITNTPDYKEYEPVSNDDGSVILYWSGETTAEPVNTTHTLTNVGGTWTKDAGFTPIPDSYWAFWSGRPDNYIGLTVMSTKDVAIYDSTGAFVMDLTGPGYSGGANQWNFFGFEGEGPNGEFVITSNAARVDPGRDIVFAAPRANLYVDPAGSDDNPGTEVAPFATIQKGVDEVSTGGTVHVAAGTYVETVTFAAGFATDSLTISGDAASRPLVDGGFLFQNTGAIDGLTLENLYIQGTARATPNERIFDMANSGAVNDFAMDNCVLDGQQVPGRIGIPGNLFGGSFSVTNTEFKDIYDWAVLDIDSSYGGPPVGGNELVLTTVTFANNYIHNCNGSVALRGNHATKTGQVHVYGNLIQDIGGQGGLSIPYWAGIEINHAQQVNLYDNTVGNIVEGAWSEGEAFQFWDVDTLDMHDNVIESNFQGVYIYCGSVGGSYGGPYAIPAGSVYQNRIAGNTQYGLALDATCTGGPLAAERNWWGDATGPDTTGVTGGDTNPHGAAAAGDAIVGYADAVPWYATSTTTPATQYVETVHNPTIAWSDTIQAAIDAALPGDTVNVSAGTYTAVDRALAVIAKALVLSGAGQAADGTGTVLDGGTYGHGTDTTGLGTAWPRAIVIQADDVTIRDLRIREYQGDQSTTGGYAIVARAEASWGVVDPTLDRLLLENITFDDCYHGIRASHVTQTTVQNTTFGATDGATDYAQYVVYSSDTVIRANTVDHGSIWVTAATNAQIGGPAPADGNIVTDATYNGIWLGQQFAAGTSSGGVIQNNTVNGAQEGGIVVWNWPGQSSAGIQILDNVVMGAQTTTDPHGGISVWSVDGTPLEIRGNESTGNVFAGISFHSSSLTQAVIANNLVSNNSGNGVDIEGVSFGDVTFSDNSFHSNTGLAMSVASSSGPLNASGNWWGSADPVNVKADANAGSGVDYTPWLGTGTDSSLDPGFQGDWSTLHVDDDSPQIGTIGRIQEGIDLVAGSTVYVEAGTYPDTFNIEGQSGLVVDGADPATVIVQPTSTVCWDVGSYGCSRATAIRIANSTDITLQDMTFDFALITGNNVTGLLMWDSTGVVSNNVLENMSLPDTAAYYEITAYVRAVSYIPANRAQVSFLGNTFVDTGRLGLITHDYVHAIVDGNTFYKTVDDFGYAMEIGSQSTAEITGNVIYGYDTPAASDGSNSAGIYIENAYTSAVTGLVKPVLIENNEIYGCQYALYVGNEFNGYAGDVDIQVTAINNNLHDNVDGAVVITDEDASAGSSVSFVGNGNTLANNGDVGYFIYTWGDGDVTVSLTGETITGQDVGVYLNDYDGTPPTGSSYALAIHESSISGNVTAGVQIDYDGAAGDLDANWWGDASGPAHATNPSGTGDVVSDHVDYSPWLGLPPGNSPMTWYTNDSIQDAVDAASDGDTIIVLPGAYPESVDVNKEVAIILQPGVLVQPSSPCFTLNADNITLSGGVCEPGNGDHGIVTAQNVNNLVLKGLEIRPGATATDDGIHLAHNVTNLQILDNYIHDLGGDGVEYVAGTSVGGVHEVQGNLFQNNGGVGINNASANSYVVEYNSWGHLDGPASGDGAAGLLDDAPWTHVLLTMLSSGTPVADKVAVGQEIVYTVQMDAQQVYGADFDLAFDNTLLEVVSIVDTGNFDHAGACGLSSVLEANTNGVISFCGNRFLSLDGAAQSLYEVTFRGLAAGVSALDFDETSDAFGMFTPSGASNNIYAAGLTDGSVTIYTGYNITGRVDLQGRADDTGAVMTFQTGAPNGYGPFPFSMSDYWGNIETANVGADTYPITVSMDRYLDVTVDSARSVSIDALKTVLAALVLLGGDANDDDAIDISDATIIGGEFGKSGGGIADVRADINNDGVVNILDLVLLGGNFGKTSATAYGTWIP